MARCARGKTLYFLFMHRNRTNNERNTLRVINSLKLTSVLLAAMANSVEKTQTENTPAVEFVGAIRKKLFCV